MEAHTQSETQVQCLLDNLEKNIDKKQDEMINLNSKIAYELDKYNQKRSDILKNYPPSETRNVMLTNAQQNYAAAIRPYKEKIYALEIEIEQINTEIDNPDTDAILSILTNICNISSIEAYKYFDDYKNCL